MTYKEWKNKGQEEFNKLPIFFAFTDEQFKREMEKRGLKETDKDKIYRLSDTGGFYLKSDAQVIEDYFSKADDLSELMKDPKFAESAFYYEMCNHEFGINMQGAYDVCSCFGDCEYKEYNSGPDYLEEMGYGADTIEAYRTARARYYKAAEENDWF